jgi:hypothetical protein
MVLIFGADGRNTDASYDLFLVKSEQGVFHSALVGTEALIEVLWHGTEAGIEGSSEYVSQTRALYFLVPL